MNWLDAAKVIAIFAVVFLHVCAPLVVDTELGSSAWWYGNVFDSLLRWCVPVFVMISGALLLDSAKMEDTATFYKKRMSRILVPLLFWTVVYLGWQVFKASITGVEFPAANAIMSVVGGRPYPHMWFIYMITALYLFTPFIRTLVRNTKRRDLWLLIVMMFAIAALNALSTALVPPAITPFVIWFLSYIPYFICGHLIATSQETRGRALAWAVFVVSGALTALGCYMLAKAKGLEAGLYFYEYLSVTTIPMSISVMWLLKSWKLDGRRSGKLALLSALTLGVYLVHPIFLESFRRLVFKPEEYYPLLTLPLASVLIFSAAMAFSYVLYKTPYLKRVI